MLKVAFATDDRVAVNQHFGAAAGFAIYALDGGHSRLVEVAEFAKSGTGASDSAMDGNEGRLAEKIASLAGCAAVYCLAVGGSAVRQLLACGIQPVRLDGEVCIDTLLRQVRRSIREGGVAWIDRHLRRAGDERFDRMAEEGWQE